MKRTQIYITEEQDRRIGALARDRGVSKASVIRQILDASLSSGEDSEVEARAILQATSGVCASYPDWPEWLGKVRGRSADERLESLGL